MLGLLFFFASFPLLPILAAPQHNHHLHSLPGFSVWQQHIQAVREAEARLGERASVGLGTSSSSDIAVDGVAETVDTREGLRKVIKSVVENNLESLESEDEEAEEKSQAKLFFPQSSFIIRFRWNSYSSEQPWETRRTVPAAASLTSSLTL